VPLFKKRSSPHVHGPVGPAILGPSRSSGVRAAQGGRGRRPKPESFPMSRLRRPAYAHPPNRNRFGGWVICFKPGPHRLQTLQYPLIPPQRCGPYIASQRCRGIRGDGVGAYSKKSVRCTKMKTDKIVAIGLKRLKTVLCHCGITDGERPLKETLHTTEIETGTSRRIANGV
jgi:hypothetical protein